MNNIKNLLPGDNLNNDQLCQIFGCSPQGGMRRSHRTNTLVLVSNHVDSIYSDRWVDDIFHYTGMGTQGDQSLTFQQNKTLTESNNNGVRVHLFEVFEDRVYTYFGLMKLADSPYFETQPDANKELRQACVFPLKPSSAFLPGIKKANYDKAYTTKERKALRLTDEEIETRAKTANNMPGARKVISKQYQRDPWVAEYAKRLANGVCQLCEVPAPFKNAKGKPYLETHHIVWLANGGEDTPENTVALCPNCHRKMHIVADRADIKFLLAKVSSPL